jgi:hypothetical protein
MLTKLQGLEGDDFAKQYMGRSGQCPQRRSVIVSTIQKRRQQRPAEKLGDPDRYASARFARGLANSTRAVEARAFGEPHARN